MKLFAALEGGASITKGILINENGDVIASIDDAESTNYHLDGIDVCFTRISSLIDQLKIQANIESETKLTGLGLSLSGCEDELFNKKLAQTFTERYPSLTDSCYVGSDTVASIFTANPNGGIVLIAGTGSNSLLINPNGEQVRCGGWGHIIGDQGSAYTIANTAVRRFIYKQENFISDNYDYEQVGKVIYEYFQISNPLEILDVAYANFNKTFFAGLCAKLAVLANNGDQLMRFIFKEAGKDLARHLLAVLPKVDKTLFVSPGGLKIVCCGSVFKSWSLLKDGFIEIIGGKIEKFTLLRLTKSAAIGAAYLSAEHAGFKLPIDFNKNSEILCEFKCCNVF